jgi:hypothetical protein
MRPIFRSFLYLAAFVAPVLLTGAIGIITSVRTSMPRPAGDVAATITPPPPSPYDPSKPTVAVALGAEVHEIVDTIGPYAMFVESGLYSSYTFAEALRSDLLRMLAESALSDTRIILEQHSYLPQRMSALWTHLAVGAMLLLVVWVARFSEPKSVDENAPGASRRGRLPEKRKRGHNKPSSPSVSSPWGSTDAPPAHWAGLPHTSRLRASNDRRAGATPAMTPCCSRRGAASRTCCGAPRASRQGRRVLRRRERRRVHVLGPPARAGMGTSDSRASWPVVCVTPEVWLPPERQ